MFDGLVATAVSYPPPPPPGTTPQERLLYLQFRENISQPDLAAIGNVSVATISNIANGHSITMNMAPMKAISDYFGLPYYFLGAYDLLPADTTAEQLIKGRLYRLYRQVDAAAYFGVDVRTYNGWEQGRISQKPQAKKISSKKLAEWISVFEH